MTKFTVNLSKISCEGEKKATSFRASYERAGEIIEAGGEAL